MPKVSIRQPKQPARPYEPLDDKDAVCEVNACGQNAFAYEVNGNTVPLYVCADHDGKQHTWEGSDPRD